LTFATDFYIISQIKYLKEGKMKRILEAFLRLTAVFAGLIVFGWAVYWVYVGELPPVNREVTIWNDSAITLPFALHHALDFLSAPIFAVLVMVCVWLYRLNDNKSGLLEYIASVGSSAVFVAIVTAPLYFFRAGLIATTLLAFPLSVVYFALFSAVVACLLLVLVLIERTPSSINLGWLLDGIDWLKSWIKKTFLDF
jgi:hypothetical protein